MKSRPHRFSQRGEALALIAGAGLSLVLMLLPVEVRITVADRLAVVLTDPYWNLRAYTQDVFRIRKQNAELLLRVTELELQAGAAERARNDEARMAGPAVDPGYTDELVPCRVVMRQSSRHATLLKIVSLEPVQWGLYQPVVSRAGYLGRIRQIISPREAWVELLSAPDFALGVEFERTGLVGIVRPRADRFVVDLVGRDQDVVPGDLVVTSGVSEVRDAAAPLEAGLAPRGFPVGTVVHVGVPNDRMFKEIWIELAASFETNETVFVVTGRDVRPGGGRP